MNDTEDAWDTPVQPALPSAEEEKRMAIAKLQQRMGQMVRHSQPVAPVPIPAGVQRDYLPLVVPVCGTLMVTVLGAIALIMGSQPRQYDAAVIQQLAENNKILAQSRPTQICVLAIVCPGANDGGSGGSAPLPAQNVNYSNPTSTETNWAEFFQNQVAAGNTATWQRYFDENPQEHGTPKYNAFIASMNGQSAIAPSNNSAPMPYTPVQPQ